MAAALKDELDVDAQLLHGRSGQFDVAVDGQVVVSRTFHGFPEDEEAVVAVAKALGRRL